MPKKDKNYYKEINALAFLLVAYCYYKMNKDEQHNNLYSYPIKTAYNWTPITLANLMLILTSTTSLILALNPGRTNFHESKTQKYLETGFKMAEGMLPLATKYGFQVAKVIAGDRAEATQDIAEEGITYIEQGFRFLTILEIIHAHKIARSFVITADAATNREEGRYLSKTAYITHNIDKAFILSVEAAVTFIWNSGAYKILNQYLHMDDKDTISSLNTLYLLADLVKFIGTKTINNLSLATEIIIYGEDKSQYYKIEEPELIKAIKSFAHKISEGFKKAAQEVIDLKNELLVKAQEIETKLLEITHFKELSEAAEEAKKEMVDSLNKLYQEAEAAKEALKHNLEEAQERAIQLAHQIEQKTIELENKILEATHLKEVKDKLDYELGKLTHYFGDQIAKFEASAATLQAHWRGFQARKQPEVKAFLDKKKVKYTAELTPEDEVDHSVASDQADNKLPTSAAIDSASKEESKENPAVTAVDSHSSNSNSVTTTTKADQPHSFLSDLFHHEPHHDDKSTVTRAQEKHHSIFDGFFVHHSSSTTTSTATTSSSDSKKPKDGKGSKSTDGASKQQQVSSSGGGSSGEVKQDKADLDEKTINSNGSSYISLVSQNFSEFSLILPKAQVEKTIAPKNEQQSQAQEAKQSAENPNNIVSINYESVIILEKPINQTKNAYQKTGQETMDMTWLLLGSDGISVLVEEGAVYNQAMGAAM